MIVKLTKQNVELLKAVLDEFGIADNDDNRQKLLNLAIKSGLVTTSFSIGITSAINHHFKIDATKQPDPKPQPSPIPDVCPDCLMPVVHVNGKNVCNCKVWREN